MNSIDELFEEYHGLAGWKVNAPDTYKAFKSQLGEIMLAERQKLLNELISRLPEKIKDIDYEDIAQSYPDLPKTIPDVYIAAQNDTLDQIKQLLEGYKEK